MINAIKCHQMPSDGGEVSRIIEKMHAYMQ